MTKIGLLTQCEFFVAHLQPASSLMDFLSFVSFFHFRFSITQWKQKCHKRLLLECHSIRDAMMAAQCSLQENYKLVFSTYYPQLSFLRCQNLLEEIFFKVFSWHGQWAWNLKIYIFVFALQSLLLFLRNF